jgi:hypothetical protein
MRTANKKPAYFFVYCNKKDRDKKIIAIFLIKQFIFLMIIYG